MFDFIIINLIDLFNVSYVEIWGLFCTNIPILSAEDYGTNIFKNKFVIKYPNIVQPGKVSSHVRAISLITAVFTFFLFTAKPAPIMAVVLA